MSICTSPNFSSLPNIFLSFSLSNACRLFFSIFHHFFLFVLTLSVLLQVSFSLARNFCATRFSHYLALLPSHFARCKSLKFIQIHRTVLHQCAPPASTVWVHIHPSSGRQKILKESRALLDSSFLQRISLFHSHSTSDFRLTLTISRKSSFS